MKEILDKFEKPYIQENSRVRERIVVKNWRKSKQEKCRIQGKQD